MPLSKSKRYARFNVGKMIKARKKQRNKIAMGHIPLQENQWKLDSVGAKKRRLEDKIFRIFLESSVSKMCSSFDVFFFEMKENIQDLANENQVLVENPSAVVDRQNSPT